MSKFYTYEDGKVKKCNLHEWVIFIEACDHRLRQTYIGTIFVSTIFLGLDHSFSDNAVLPVLWETRVFVPKEMSEANGLDDGARYQTEKQAEHGHKVFIERVREMYPLEKVTEVDVCLGAHLPNYEEFRDRIEEGFKEKDDDDEHAT